MVMRVCGSWWDAEGSSRVQLQPLHGWCAPIISRSDARQAAGAGASFTLPIPELLLSTPRGTKSSFSKAKLRAGLTVALLCLHYGLRGVGRSEYETPCFIPAFNWKLTGLFMSRHNVSKPESKTGGSSTSVMKMYCLSWKQPSCETCCLHTGGLTMES